MKIMNLFIILLMTCSLSFAQENVRILQRETVLDLKWGDGPNEIGLIQGEYIFGPASFLVDGNNTIYILDSANERMSIFNAKGELVRNFPVTGIGETCWGDNGHIFMNDGNAHNILEYTIDGQLLSKYIYKLDSNMDSSNLIVRDGIFYIWNYKIVPLESFAIDSKGASIYETETSLLQSEDAPRNIGAFSKNRYLMDNNVYYSESRNSEKREILDSLLGKHALFLQEDTDGNQYFLILDTDNGIKTRNIWKLDTAYRHVATIGPLYQKVFADAFKEICIDSKGSVYQLTSDNDGVRIFTWR